MDLKIVALEYAKAHADDLAAGFFAALTVYLIVEAVKPFAQWGVARLGWEEDTEEMLFKSMPYLVGSAVAVLYDFGAHWQNMTGVELDVLSIIVVGGALTGGASQLGYRLTHRLSVIQTLQVRWQRLMGVTPEDLKRLRASNKGKQDGNDDTGRKR